MTDPRAVRNPFTKNDSHLRRNTGSSKWVPVDSGHNTTRGPSPGKIEAHEVQHLQHPGHSIVTHGNEYRGRLPQEKTAPLMSTTTAMYEHPDLQEITDAHRPLPTVRSWGSLRPSINEVPEDVPASKLTSSQKPQLDLVISPLVQESVGWRDSVVSNLDPKDSVPEGRQRQEHTVTMTSKFTSTVKKPEGRSTEPKPTQASSHSGDIYHTAKAIYAAGPKGEGQKLWKSYKLARKAKQDRSALLQNTQPPLGDVETPQSQHPSDAPALSAHPPSRPNRPPPSQIRIEPRKPVPVNQHLYHRKLSDVSGTSRHVPLGIDTRFKSSYQLSKPLPAYPTSPSARNLDGGIHPAQFDLSEKPLPLAPRGQIHPSQFDPSQKPLPLAPHGQIHPSQFDPSQKPLPLAPHPRIPNTPTPQPPQKSKEPKESRWWTCISSKPSSPHTLNPKNNNTPTISKLNISRPHPITALEQGRTVNLAPEHGGVGGYGAYSSSSSSSMREESTVEQAGSSSSAAEISAKYRQRERRDGDGGGEEGLEVVEQGGRDTGFYEAVWDVLREY